MDAVRAADRHRHAVFLGAPRDRLDRGLDSLEQQLPGVADLQRQRRVDDVGRGEPEVHPAPLRPQLLGQCIDERGGVVVGRLLDLGDARGSRRHGVLADRSDVGRGDGADLSPSFERRQLDLEPARQLRVVRPDLCHGRSRVAGDH